MTEPLEDIQALTILVDNCISTRSITYQQYRQLSSMVLADGNVDDQERRQINRLFDAIRGGMVKLVD